MGLLRRPTPGEITEDGRLARPCGPGARIRAHLRKPIAPALPSCKFYQIGAPYTGAERSQPSITAVIGQHPASQTCLYSGEIGPGLLNLRVVGAVDGFSDGEGAFCRSLTGS